MLDQWFTVYIIFEFLIFIPSKDSYGILEGDGALPDDWKFMEKTGDTVATLMGWIGDVEAGGGTAFSDPGHCRCHTLT